MSLTEIELTREHKVFLETGFFSTGKCPTHHEFQEQFKLSRSQLVELIPAINSYKKDANLENPITDLLTPEQFNLATLLLNTDDRRSVRMKLKQLNISMATYNKWKQNPAFVNYVRTQANRRLQLAGPAADLALVKLLEDGDLKAVMYYNDITGRYTSSDQINIAQVLAMVMEVLVSYVTPEVLKQVAQGLETRLNGVIDVSAKELER